MQILLSVCVVVQSLDYLSALILYSALHVLQGAVMSLRVHLANDNSQNACFCSSCHKTPLVQHESDPSCVKFCKYVQLECFLMVW